MSNLLPARGRAGTLLMMTVERELNPTDFLTAAIDPGHKLGPAVVQRLHARHHRAARLIAEGKTIQQVAALTDYSAQRISDLSSTDPAFRELVARYQESITDTSLDEASKMQAKLIDVGTTAVEEIRERLEDDSKRALIPIAELRQIAQFATDRTVAPPKQAVTTGQIPPRITFNIGTRNIDPASRDATPNAMVIEHDPIDSEPSKDD